VVPELPLEVVLGAEVDGCKPEPDEVLDPDDEPDPDDELLPDVPLDPECARGTVAAIATPPATLAAVTPQVTADIRTSLRRASRSMATSTTAVGSPPTVIRRSERVMNLASTSTLRRNSEAGCAPAPLRPSLC